MNPELYTDRWNIIAIDKSGSMSGQQSDVIGGYSNLLDEQKENKLSGKNRWTVLSFNEKVEEIYDVEDIDDADDLESCQIRPRGSTAILDTLGYCYNKIVKNDENYDYINIHIITDGLENSSRQFTSESLNSLKEAVMKKYNINLFFIGADKSCLQGVEHLGPQKIEDYSNNIITAFRSVSNNISDSQKKDYSGGSRGDESQGKYSCDISEAQKCVTPIMPRRAMTEPPLLSKRQQTLDIDRNGIPDNPQPPPLKKH